MVNCAMKIIFLSKIYEFKLSDNAGISFIINDPPPPLPPPPPPPETRLEGGR